VARPEAAYRRSALNEASVLKGLQHCSSVINFIESFEQDGSVCIVMELLYQNLYELLRDQKFVATPLDYVRKTVTAVLIALMELHKMSYIHCDVKPENVMCRGKRDYDHCCLIDFGAVRKHTENKYFDIQSLWYRAPEVICGIPYTTAIDAWSVGCLMYELHTGNPLFAGSDAQEQLSLIIEMLGVPSQEAMQKGANVGQLTLSAANQSGMTRHPRVEDAVIGDPVTCEQFCDLVYQLLNPNEQLRYSISDALNHPFISGATWRGPTSMRMNFGRALVSSSSASDGLSSPPTSADTSPEWRRINSTLEDDDAPKGFSNSGDLVGPPSIDEWV
jgi:serine/threonine protein kinase